MPRRFLLASALALSLGGALSALADDASDVRSTISAQLRAFKAGNSVEAYAYAAPSIQAMFPSPDIFMSMVKSGYAVVANSNNVVFGTMQAENGGFRQEVNMTDSTGESFIASYTLMRQPDGSLRITSCTIRKANDFSA